MTRKKPGASRRRFIALCVASLLVIALLACWQWRVAGSATTPVAAASSAAAGAPPVASTLNGQRDAVRRHGASDLDAAAPENPLDALCREHQQQRLTTLRDRIQATESPDDAITHALLTLLVGFQDVNKAKIDSSAAGQELVDASKRWPDNLDLAWMRYRMCAPDFGCDRDDALHHLIDIDQDNAAVWITVMQREAPGTEANAQTLHRAATARFYDTRYGVTFVHLQPILATIPPPENCVSKALKAQLLDQLGHPATAAEWADMMAVTMESATGMIPYGGVAKSCTADTKPTMTTSRRHDCLALLSRISNGDTLLEQSLGLGLQIKLAGDGPGSGQLRERYRRLQWLLAHGRQLKFGSDIERVMREGEVATGQALATEQGLWPPPSD